MEFVKLKYANNMLINSDIKEHRDVIKEYVDEKGYEYVGFVPTLFAPNGKPMEIDLLFKKPSSTNTADKNATDIAGKKDKK